MLRSLVGSEMCIRDSVNGVLCSRNAKHMISDLFGEEALFVPYTDPGYTLFKKLESEIEKYRGRFHCCLLYTSDAADDLLCVDLGGRRIIKKKKKQNNSAN